MVFDNKYNCIAFQYRSTSISCRPMISIVNRAKSRLWAELSNSKLAPLFGLKCTEMRFNCRSNRGCRCHRCSRWCLRRGRFAAKTGNGKGVGVKGTKESERKEGKGLAPIEIMKSGRPWSASPLSVWNPSATVSGGVARSLRFYTCLRRRSALMQRSMWWWW